jgi:putative transcriptional regulator
MGRSSARGRHNTVRDARRALDLTQAELADQVGVSRQTIVAVENGGYAPSVYLALALGDTLGMSVERLFRPTDEEPREGSSARRTTR